MRPATEFDLPQLEALPFSGGLPSKHRDRLLRQLGGQAVYVLAKQEVEIVGHLLLKWDCPEDRHVRTITASCAEIEDFVVKPALRRQGIGSAMLDHAARLCLDRGIANLGLGVGLGNPDARALYERRGFALVPESDHRVTWTARDAQGHEFKEHDDCVYLVKDLT
jgi:GNAT superfamily N-acetyltransferase